MIKNVSILLLIMLFVLISYQQYEEKMEIQRDLYFLQKKVAFLKKMEDIHQNEIVALESTNRILYREIEKFKNEGIEVTVTMYRPLEEETDSTPHITADGTVINIKNAGKYRYVAVSRDLLRTNGGVFRYGDYLLLKGTKIKDGIYQVRDTMAPRWEKTVDILESPDCQWLYRFSNAMIYRLDWIL